ncbi:DUF1828 domain-containing protein [Taylorella equigenitalis]|nr:DUF1828 domain-containing protein [Taylorella equigenitalis]
MTPLVNDIYEISDYDDVCFHIRGWGVRDFYDEDKFPEVHDLVKHYGIRIKGDELVVYSTKDNLIENFKNFTAVIKQIVDWDKDLYGDGAYHFDVALSTPKYLQV